MYICVTHAGRYVQLGNDAWAASCNLDDSLPLDGATLFVRQFKHRKVHSALQPHNVM